MSGEGTGGLSELNMPQMVSNGHGPSPHGSFVHEGTGSPGSHGVAGFVHDGAGNPVSFAAITIAGPDGNQLGRTNTGPDGRYAFQAPPGDYLVITTAPGWSPQAATVLVGVAGAVQDFALVPDDSGPTGELRGVVRSPEGVPLGGITTTVTDETGEVIATTTTGYDGAYHITGLADGHYTVVAAGHRPATVAVRVDGGEPMPCLNSRPLHPLPLPCTPRDPCSPSCWALWPALVDRFRPDCDETPRAPNLQSPTR